MTGHEQKAAILWSSFKERLGISENLDILFDLSGSDHSVNLDELEAPFTHEEIDEIIQHMPSDKSPGPDSFNGCFMKKC